jgi:hypothetical protein
MAKLNWEKANQSKKDTSLDFKIDKQIVKRPKKSASLCKMRGCKDKRYKTSFGYRQSYCLSHCKQFNKKL